MEAIKQAPVMDVRAFTGELQPVINESDAVPATLADYEHLRITVEKEYQNIEPVITWDGSGIAAPRNITAISAQAKAGKTAFINMLAGGAISEDGLCEMFGQIKVVPNELKKAVLIFDTEQDEADQQYNVRTILRRAVLTSTPDNLLSYNIRQLSMNEYKTVTNAICEAASNQFGGIHSIFIDGVADYIKDVNSIEQATEIREYFVHLAIRYDCPVILVIHQNPGTTKERGHLGSEIQRKCYGIVTITKDGDLSTAKSNFTRKAGELEPIHFKYSKDAGYHVQVDAPVNEARANKLVAIENIIKEVLTPLDAFTYTDLGRRIVGATACSTSTANRYISVAEANKWLTKGDDGRYRLSTINHYQTLSN